MYSHTDIRDPRVTRLVVMPRVRPWAAVLSVVTLAACAGTSSRAADTTLAAAPNAAPVAVAAGAGVGGAPVASALPAPVEAVGHYGEDAYDMAQANDWAKARIVVDSLKQATAALPATLGADTSAGPGAGTISANIAALDRAVTARDHSLAMRTANQLTADGARLADRYHPQVPPAVTMLDYYGRELEIWSAANNAGKLRETATAMRRTWDGLRPQVEARGGTATATRFGALVARVDSARTPAAYASVAKPVLAEVDSLEHVFTR